MNYLYNGVELPALPEWDKAAYPYAYIANYNDVYYLWFQSTPKLTNGGNVIVAIGNPSYLAKDGAWVKANTGGGTIIWANADVYYGAGDAIPDELEGTLYLAASEPVPVLSIDHTAMVQGWIVGKRLAAQRRKA